MPNLRMKNDKSMDKDVDKKAEKNMSENIDLYQQLVEELMKDIPDQIQIRKLCQTLKIPFSLNSSTQIGNVFKKLQSLKPQAMTE